MKAGYSYFTAPTEITSLKNNQRWLLKSKRKETRFYVLPQQCYLWNILWKGRKHERKGGQEILNVIKPFLLPIYKKYKEQCVNHHHENAVHKIHRNSSGQIELSSFTNNCKEKWRWGGEWQKRSVNHLQCTQPSCGASQTNFLKSPFIRQERNYEHRLDIWWHKEKFLVIKNKRNSKERDFLF